MDSKVEGRMSNVIINGPHRGLNIPDTLADNNSIISLYDRGVAYYYEKFVLNTPNTKYYFWCLQGTENTVESLINEIVSSLEALHAEVEPVRMLTRRAGKFNAT